MSTPIHRDELDKHMEAWRMYYVDKRPTSAIAAHFGVSGQSIRNWLTALGGVIDDDEQQRVFRDKIAASLIDGEMLCAACDIICETHETGLCPSCQGERERETEREAELALFSDAAFLDNPRNIGRFDPKKVGSVRGVRAVW